MARFRTTAVLLLGIGLVSCSILKSTHQVPARHPEELPVGRPLCSAESCHGRANEGLPYARFDHSASFAGGGHRNEVSQQGRVCAMCHEQSFCNDCHVTRSELKPPERDATNSYRTYPHRGDYLSRHRIDARVDPTSCMRCHGNPKSSKACVACHGK